MKNINQRKVNDIMIKLYKLIVIGRERQANFFLEFTNSISNPFDQNMTDTPSKSSTPPNPPNATNCYMAIDNSE